jgi:hypothetical protein
LIKPLYDNAGIKWGSKQDEDVEKLIKNIMKDLGIID